MKKYLSLFFFTLVGAFAQTAKDRATLYSQVDTTLPSGQGITAATLRTMFKDAFASTHVKLTDGTALTTSGGTVLGDLTLSGTAANRYFALDTSAGQTRLLDFKTAGLLRWSVGAGNTAESGGNAGSIFQIFGYGDDGATRTVEAGINRANGSLYIHGSSGGPVFGGYSSSSVGPVIYLEKARGTLAAPTAAQEGDTVGGLYMRGYGNTQFRNVASILGQTTQLVGATSGGKLVFQTVTNGATAYTTRLSLDSTGATFTVPVSTTDLTASGTVTISGNVTAPPGGKVVFYVPEVPSENEFVDVQTLNNAPQSDSRYGLRSLLTVGGGNSSHGYRSGAILGEVLISPGNSQDYAGIQTGLYGLAHHGGSGSMGNLMAQYLVTGIYGTGGATDGFGQYISGLQYAGSAGRFTNFYGTYFAPFAVDGSGLKPTNLYGYYFADNDGKADNVYAFYSAGNAPSQLSGAVTVGSLNTGGAITNTGVTPATALGTGTITTAGGMSVTKNIWLGQQLRFESSTDNTIGINFGGSSYLYQYGAGNVRLSSANFYLQGDFLPTANASFDLGATGTRWRQLFVSGAGTIGGTLTLGTGPTTVSDSAGKILSAALNTVAVAQGGTGATDAGTARTNLGLGNVENTALSTWGGSTNIVTLGNVTTGTWSGTTIGTAKGGTSHTSYTNGQLLIGNTTSGGLDKATLTAGTGVTITNGAGSITINSTASGGGTKTYAKFSALDGNPPASNYATFDTRNSVPVLDFDDSTEEATVFSSIMPEGASLGSGLIIRIHWAATSATTGAVRWGGQLERGNTDLDADSFDTATEAHSTTSGTSGTVTITEITTTNIDGITAGDGYRLKVYRDVTDTTNDTMTGDAELVWVEVRSAS